MNIDCVFVTQIPITIGDRDQGVYQESDHHISFTRQHLSHIYWRNEDSPSVLQRSHMNLGLFLKIYSHRNECTEKTDRVTQEVGVCL